MSYCRKEGKDEIIFLTADEDQNEEPAKDGDSPSPAAKEEVEPQGLIKENGDINWDCPCLQGMADGPCGEPFKEAFACFHYSESEPKGYDCLDNFKAMQECFIQYPEIYGGLDEDLKEDGQATKTTDGSESAENEVSQATTTDDSKSAKNEVIVKDVTQCENISSSDEKLSESEASQSKNENNIGQDDSS